MSQPVISVWCSVVVLFTMAGSAGDDQNWPSFRGHRANGVAEGHTTPVHWDLEKGENILWKTPIPGMGHSSPAIWGDCIFITSAVEDEGESRLKVGLYGSVEPEEEDTGFSWQLFCINKKNGKYIWHQTACSGKPKVKRHPKSSQANPTPCTNGKAVVAFFGSEGLYCYDMGGKLIWKKDLGILDAGYFRMPGAQWGGGASPVIHEDMVILQCDVQKNSFLAAFDLADGKELWRTPRNDYPTWGTPTVYTGKPAAQIIVNGYKHIGGYALKTGKEIWRLTGGGDIPVPTPILFEDLAFITNAHGRMAPIYAVRLTATGDISLPKGALTNEHVIWSVRRGGNYMQTPLVYKEHLYCCSDSGRLSCFEAKSGKQHYLEKLGGPADGFTASPVAADGKVYCTGEDGDIHVIETGPEFKLLATNKMRETCMATPAISEGTLFFRTRHHLVAIAEGK